MDHRPPPAIGARTAAGGLTLAVHGLLVTALLMEDRGLMRPLPASRAPADIWIHLAPVLVTEQVEPAHQTAPPSSQRAMTARADAGALSPPSPQTAPRIPAEPPAESPVNWDLAAEKRTSNYGEEDTPPPFGLPAAKMRESCKPRDSSFEWSPAEERAGLYPLPYMMVGERCVIGLAFFGCALGEAPPPNTHLFDDMQKGLTAKSVPDPDYCD